MKKLMVWSAALPLAGCAIDNLPKDDPPISSFAATAHRELTPEDLALIETAPEIAIIAVPGRPPCKSGFVTGSRIRRVTCVSYMSEAEALLVEMKTDYEIDYSRRVQMWAEAARLDERFDVPGEMQGPPFQ